jgi:hypothetical protein
MAHYRLGRSRALSALAPALALCLGCTGHIGGESAAHGDAAVPTPTPADGDGSIADPGQPRVLGQCTSADRRLHRLSHAEFDRSVQVLLGDTSGPARAFPVDVNNAKAFANNADGTSLSPLLVEAYERAATELIESAWQRDEARPVADRVLRFCEPAVGDASCSRQVLARLAERAWRRPVPASDVDRLLQLEHRVVTIGESPAGALKAALRAVVLAPEFLFRIDQTAPEVPLTTTPTLVKLDAHSLASRLSYSAWGAPPDLELLTLAASGQLLDSATWASQVSRVFDDVRAQGLVETFFETWLDTPRVEAVDRDAALFPSFDGELRELFRRETAMLASAFLTENLDARLLLRPGFTFLNDRLAAHYGLPLVGSAELVRTAVADFRRGGLLGHGSVLSITSVATRTSPVRRGKWVFERLFCTEPPEPPPNVDTNPPPVAPSLTLRDRLEQHSQDPACVGCHRLLDPIGFGLENFDAVGAYREQDNGVPLRIGGTLDSGQAFTTPEALVELLAADPRVVHCAAEKAYGFAAGRNLRDEDADEITELAHKFQEAGFGFKHLFRGIAESARFQGTCAALPD